jgi:hypothetical protein
MSNHERRLERLERGRKRGGFVVILVHPGETAEEAWQKNLALHPESEKAKGRMNIHLSAQDSSGAPPPPRPKPEDSAPTSGSGPLQITR